MFTRCLVCQTPFPENEYLEHFPRGKRIAYDPARGRLWVVCLACKRWSLTPIEERWEALDELEKVVRDKAHLLSQTDNIALMRAGPIEIVRVGKANLTEEAWWRYGQVLKARKESAQKVALAGSVAAGAIMLGGWMTGMTSLIAVWFLWKNAPGKFTEGARWLRFGSTAWRGREQCAHCGHWFRDLKFIERSGIILLPANEEDHHVVVQRCPGCGHYRDGGLHLEGRSGEQVLRRVLAYNHFWGASEQRVKSATRLIEEAGSPQDLKRIVIRDGKRLGDLMRTGAIALEIAANESSEQRLLELELADLEAHWRTEEELAAIVDGELTPLPVFEKLRLKMTGKE